MAIKYTNDIAEIPARSLSGFFVGWPKRPDPATHLELLRRSQVVWMALDGDRCVGFINALSDGVFYAYIPLLEVLPAYQGRGIGRELLRRMTETLDDMYAIDVVCDERLASFYAKSGFMRCAGMVRRNYAKQHGPLSRWP